MARDAKKTTKPRRSTQPVAVLPPMMESPLSGTLLPSDQLRLLIELMRPLGPHQSRRWLAALLLVDRDERDGLIELVEQHVSQRFVQRRTDAPAGSNLGLGPKPPRKPRNAG